MRRRLLFLGDSLIEYFDWAKRFPKHEVCNLDIAGETVEGLHARLRGIFRRVKDQDMVFIKSGINSMAVGEEGIADIYGKIVLEIRQAYPSAKVIVQSLLPVLFPYIQNEDTQLMNASLKQMAVDEGVLHFDIHCRFLDEGGRPVAAFLMEDGLHVSEAGYRVWSDHMEGLLEIG